MKVLLYSTGQCHLCELAATMLGAIPISVEHVDVTKDEVLMKKYGMHIPVVCRTDNNTELGWPFDADMLKRFLQ